MSNQFPSTTSTASGPLLTLAMLEESFDRMRSKIGQQRENDLYRAQAQAFSAYAKQRYAVHLGVATLSVEQEKEMWDGMSHAWARYVGLEDAEGNLL